MKKNVNISFLLITTILMISSNPAFTQAEESKEIVIGYEATLFSKTLNEDRRLQIHLPPGYENSSTKYPVIYLLDGPGHFHHTTGITTFLANQNRMPEMIVVAIANTDRTRDLTPHASDTKQFPTAGGADNFLAFMKDELFPHIEANYRTQPYRLLIGHSFGGLFALHTLMTQPEMFNSYLAISPSTWWDDQRLVKDAEKFFEANKRLKKDIYMTMGNEGGAMLSSARKIAETMEKKQPEGFSSAFKHMNEETHGSIPHRSTYYGLETIFINWRFPENIKNPDLKDIQGHFLTLSERYDYNILPPENTVNQLGYRYLGQKKYNKAIEAFKYNVKTYPSSANVYDSLGEAYEQNKQSDLALKNYTAAYEKAKAENHPNLSVYQKNMERVKGK